MLGLPRAPLRSPRRPLQCRPRCSAGRLPFRALRRRCKLTGKLERTIGQPPAFASPTQRSPGTLCPVRQTGNLFSVPAPAGVEEIDPGQGMQCWRCVLGLLPRTPYHLMQSPCQESEKPKESHPAALRLWPATRRTGWNAASGRRGSGPKAPGANRCRESGRRASRQPDRPGRLPPIGG